MTTPIKPLPVVTGDNTIHFVKRTTILLFCMLSVISVYAGKKQLFNDAISRGADAKGFFCINNESGDNVSMQDMRLYVSKQNYYAAKGESDGKGRVKKLYFIAPKDYSAYVYYELSTDKKDLKQLTNKGKVILFEVKRDWLGSNTGCVMSNLQEAFWIGNIVDGKVHGKGSGLIAYPSSKYYIYFEGEFDNGCPKSETVMRYYTADSFKSSNITIPRNKFREEKAPAPQTKDYAQILTWEKTTQATKDCLNKRLATVYTHAAEWLEKARKDALGVNMSNYKTFTYSKDVEEFHKLYTKLKYDPQHILAKAEEMIDFYDIVEDMKMSINNKIGFSLLWQDRSPSEKRQIVEEGIAKAKKWQTQGKCGLGKFYALAIKDLSDKSKELSRKISEAEKIRRENQERYTKETETANKMSWVEPDKEEPWKEETGIFGNAKGDYSRYVMWNSKHMNGESKGFTIYKYGDGSMARYGIGTGVLYRNYNDAVAAAYVYLKTGYVRTVGKD